MPDQSDSPSNLPEAAVNALWRGELIEAIKMLRLERGIGLKEAKDAVDAYIRTQPPLRQKLEEANARAKEGLLRWLVVIGLILAVGAYFFLR